MIPHWTVTALAATGAWFLASVILGAAWVVLRTWQHHRRDQRHQPPAPAATPPRAPASPGPGAAAGPPAMAMPGPGSLMRQHATGGIDFTVRVWHCGCTWRWDGNGILVSARPCTTDITEEIRNYRP